MPHSVWHAVFQAVIRNTHLRRVRYSRPFDTHVYCFVNSNLILYLKFLNYFLKNYSFDFFGANGNANGIAPAISSTFVSPNPLPHVAFFAAGK